MKDVTDDVTMHRTKVGTRIEYEILHNDQRIGHLEPGGPVLEDKKKYRLKFVPNRATTLEQRIYEVEATDVLETD